MNETVFRSCEFGDYTLLSASWPSPSATRSVNELIFCVGKLTCWQLDLKLTGVQYSVIAVNTKVWNFAVHNFIVDKEPDLQTILTIYHKFIRKIDLQ